MNFNKLSLMLFLSVLSIMPAQGMSYDREMLLFKAKLALGYYEPAFNQLQKINDKDKTSYFSAINDHLLSSLIKLYGHTYPTCSQLLHDTMHKYPESRAIFKNYALANFDTFIKKAAIENLAEIIKENYPNNKEFIPLVLKNITVVGKEQSGMHLLIHFLEKYPENEKNIMDLIISNIEHMDDYGLCCLIRGKTDLYGFDTVLKYIARKHGTSEALEIIGYDCNKLDQLTPSGIHIINNPFVLISKFSKSFLGSKNPVKDYLEDSQLKHTFKEVIAKERLLKDDYYLFFHGQRLGYYYPEKLYTFLWQIRKKRSVSNFLFAHVKKLINDPKIFDEEKVYKNFLLSRGRIDDYSRQMLLFMNYALFGNSSWHNGSSTAMYVALNDNVGKINLSAKMVCDYLDYPHIYNQFKNELDTLEVEYQRVSARGNLLLIAIPKEKIEKYVYLSHTGGVKRDLLLWNDKRKDAGNMDSDITHIMKLLSVPTCDLDTDSPEFCLIMTQKKGGMDPDTGIKIFPLLSGDPAKLAELQKREDALFAKIKAAIDADEKVKMQAVAVARANAITNHIVQSKNAAPIVPAKTMARVNMIMNHVQMNGMS